MRLSEAGASPPISFEDRDIVLSVKNVSKRFCRDLKRSLLYGVQDIAGEILGAKRKDVELRKGEFWALNDVSFELRRGEALGLVGANGAGKTTLLRIISGLIIPDHGSVAVKGRLAPLIALGAGFNPILTGRENIYVNMSILGLSKEEIDERFDEVVDFAEIGEAIDAPVQSYSSGMQARLGFASAIFTEPDILLIDEVLAVGDIRFQAKCHRRLSQLSKHGTSFLLVSHNTQTMLGVCNAALYLRKGRKILDGLSTEVILKYEKDLDNDFHLDKPSRSAATTSSDLTSSTSNAEAMFELKIYDSYFEDEQNCRVEELICGHPASLCIACRADKDLDDVTLRLIFTRLDRDGDTVQILNSQSSPTSLALVKGENLVKVEMPFVSFRPGNYNLRCVIREGNLHTLAFIDSMRFSVSTEVAMFGCQFFQPHIWKVFNL